MSTVPIWNYYLGFTLQIKIIHSTAYDLYAFAFIFHSIRPFIRPFLLLIIRYLKLI